MNVRFHHLCGLGLLLSLSTSLFALGPKQQVGEWRVYREEAGQAPTIKAVLYAVEGEDSALGIRCEKQQPEIYFIFSDNIPKEASRALKVQADGAPISHGTWSRSSSKNGAFATYPYQFLPLLADKQNLIVTYQNEQQYHKVTAFQLDGINEVIAQFNQVCRR